jgi:hypothetical protein
MPTAKKEAEATERSTLTRLAERGEEALKRLADELDRNARVHDALERLERVEKSVLNRLNIASLDEVEELRKQVAKLEKRLAKAESGAGKGAAAAPGDNDSSGHA